ncbi:hypothetical protein [Lysinibacillus xylanilyticus]
MADRAAKVVDSPPKKEQHSPRNLAVIDISFAINQCYNSFYMLE